MRTTTEFNYLIVGLQLTIVILVLHTSFFRTDTTGVETAEPFGGTVAVIPVKGEITVSSFDFTWDVAASDEIVPMIERANKTPSLKAIVLDINSFGGSPVAADEIAAALKSSGKPTVAWIRESGQSAAYRIASAADWIIGNKDSDIGSIGAVVQYELQNVTYEIIKGGRYKDMYVDNRLMTDEERKIAQEQVDLSHQQLIQDIADNRNMDPQVVAELADGRSWLGVTAQELGLLDELGGKQEVIRYIEGRIGEKAVLAYYNTETQAFDLGYP